MTIAWGQMNIGVAAERQAAHRTIFLNGTDLYLPGGRYIDGTQSRDPGNTGNLTVLRAGMLMGKISATTFGGIVDYYAPAFIGVTTGAYTSGGTELTVSAAQAVELDRIVGQSGTAELVAIGPPTTTGTLAVTDITHSAINTSTGVLTVSSLGVDKIAGTLIAVKDGRQYPRTFIPDNEYGLLVVDTDGTALDAVDFPRVPIAGNVDSSQIINWPSNAVIQAWIVNQLNGTDGGVGSGQFVFDHVY